VEKKTMFKLVNFTEYVQEVLKTAEYRKGEDFECIIAIAKALPGCLTQGKNYEEARTNLIDAIETWIISAIKDGEELPEVNNCKLIIGKPEELEAAHA